MGTTANSTTQYTRVAYQSNIYVPDSEDAETFGFLARVQSEALTLVINDTANGAPDADLIIQTGVYARTSGSKNRFGLRTRAVIIKRLVGTAPLQFYIKRTVPWLQINLDTVIEETTPPIIGYQGQTDWVLVDTRDEYIGPG